MNNGIEEEFSSFRAFGLESGGPRLECVVLCAANSGVDRRKMGNLQFSAPPDLEGNSLWIANVDLALASTIKERWGAQCNYALGLGRRPADVDASTTGNWLENMFESENQDEVTALCDFLFKKLARPAKDDKMVDPLGLLAVYITFCRGSTDDKLESLYGLFDFAGQGEMPHTGMIVLVMSLYHALFSLLKDSVLVRSDVVRFERESKRIVDKMLDSQVELAAAAGRVPGRPGVAVEVVSAEAFHGFCRNLFSDDGSICTAGDLLAHFESISDDSSPRNETAKGDRNDDTSPSEQADDANDHVEAPAKDDIVNSDGVEVSQAVDKVTQSSEIRPEHPTGGLVGYFEQPDAGTATAAWKYRGPVAESQSKRASTDDYASTVAVSEQSQVAEVQHSATAAPTTTPEAGRGEVGYFEKPGAGVASAAWLYRGPTAEAVSLHRQQSSSGAAAQASGAGSVGDTDTAEPTDPETSSNGKEDPVVKAGATEPPNSADSSTADKQDATDSEAVHEDNGESATEKADTVEDAEDEVSGSEEHSSVENSDEDEASNDDDNFF